MQTIELAGGAVVAVVLLIVGFFFVRRVSTGQGKKYTDLELPNEFDLEKGDVADADPLVVSSKEDRTDCGQLTDNEATDAEAAPTKMDESGELKRGSSPVMPSAATTDVEDWNARPAPAPPVTEGQKSQRVRTSVAEERKKGARGDSKSLGRRRGSSSAEKAKKIAEDKKSLLGDDE